MFDHHLTNCLRRHRTSSFTEGTPELVDLKINLISPKLLPIYTKSDLK